MSSRVIKLHIVLMVMMLSTTCGFAQKVNVGYDKSIDFSKFKTYTLMLPPSPTSRPLLYASVVGSIRNGIETKGLVSVEKGGDLTVIAAKEATRSGRFQFSRVSGQRAASAV